MHRAKVRCCISQTARWALTRLKNKDKWQHRNELAMLYAFNLVDEFKDAQLTCEHPHVDAWILSMLHSIHPQLELWWELQHYFEHRWHVVYNDDGNIKSVLVLQQPDAPLMHQAADYKAITMRELSRVRRSMFILKHGQQLAVTDALLAQQELAEERKIAAQLDLADQKDKAERHLQERILGKRNISDPGWEAGVGFNADGTPYVSGPGAHRADKITKAV